MTEEALTLRLSQDEALVLFEWLQRVDDRDDGWVDQAEQRAVWDLTAALERQLVAPFAADYQAQLDAARGRVRDVPD